MSVTYELPDGFRPLYVRMIDVHHGEAIRSTPDGGTDVEPLILLHVTPDEDGEGLFTIPLSQNNALVLMAGLAAGLGWRQADNGCRSAEDE